MGRLSRSRLSARDSRPIIDRLHKVFQKLIKRYLPQSSMGKALSYALKQWELLSRYVDHGEVEIDDNLVENAIRPTAIGKKNWMFMGHKESGQRNAVIYSLVETCRMLDIEPYAYLKDILQRLPTATNKNVSELTPANWLRAKRLQNPKRRKKNAPV